MNSCSALYLYQSFSLLIILLSIPRPPILYIAHLSETRDVRCLLKELDELVRMESEGKFDGMLLHIAQQHSEGIEQVSKSRDLTCTCALVSQCGVVWCVHVV